MDYKKDEKYKNAYEKTVLGIACLGNTTTYINKKKKQSYRIWYAMIQRCYKACYNIKPTYIDCYVCDEWLCYENFEKWYDNNYYQINNEKMDLDKDILKSGNKCYCPEYCVFIPHSLNSLFRNYKRIYDLPVGVVRIKKKYIARCRDRYLGTFLHQKRHFIDIK